MSPPVRFLLAAPLVLICLVYRDALERDPVTHVLVQLPLLIAAGWQVGRGLAEGLPRQPSDWNLGGAPLLIVAGVTLAYWMLPRAIDGALTEPWREAAKFLSLPLLAGLPLAMAWPRAPILLRGFLKAKVLSMLGILAFLYTHAPVRICNAYLVDDQERLGWGFLHAALALAVIWCAPLFVGRRHGDAAPPYRQEVRTA